MATVTKTRKVGEDVNSWVRRVNELTEQVESWAKARKWPMHRETKRIEESGLGAYTVPVLSILAPSGTFQLDPVARHVAKADGRIDLIAWPSMTRMMLVRIGNVWKLKTDSGVMWPEKWGQRTFERLTEFLSNAAA
jgi:hypothetical protein